MAETHMVPRQLNSAIEDDNRIKRGRSTSQSSPFTGQSLMPLTWDPKAVNALIYSHISIVRGKNTHENHEKLIDGKVLTSFRAIPSLKAWLTTAAEVRSGITANSTILTRRRVARSGFNYKNTVSNAELQLVIINHQFSPAGLGSGSNIGLIGKRGRSDLPVMRNYWQQVAEGVLRISLN